jgi:tRNA pseudouridine38-40 synthase
VALSSELSGPVLLRALNGMASDVYFTHAREVPVAFRPRPAQSRWYRYYEPAETHRILRWRQAAKILTGPLDARSFGRGVPAAVPTFRTIDRIEVAAHDGLFEVDVHARSFVWGMVRKIVAALQQFDAGDITATELEAGARGRRRISLPMAEPEGLVLWDVVYPEPWEFTASGASHRQLRALDAARRSLQVRAAVLGALGDVAPTGSRGKRTVGL